MLSLIHIFHSLLPLDDCLLWVRNLSMCAALGTAAASFSFQRRMGRRAFAVLPLAALSALCFPPVSYTHLISMLVLDYAYNLPYRQIINSNNIGIAIMQGLSGSFGIVLAVPVTVALAVLLYTWRKAAPAA